MHLLSFSQLFNLCPAMDPRTIGAEIIKKRSPKKATFVVFIEQR